MSRVCSLSIFLSFHSLASNKIIFPSADPVAKNFPLVLKAAVVTEADCANTFILSPDLASHTSARLSTPPVTINVASKLIAADNISPV